MALPPTTPSDIQRLIQESGYPFELEVALVLQSLGYNVALSHQYFNAQRQRAGEVDILATRSFTDDTDHAGTVHRTLELVIECKDNSFPYVLFGFPSPPSPPPGSLDGDIYYNKFRSTQDKFENYLSLVSLGEDRVKGSKAIKSRHHQFSTGFRFHQAAAVEIQGGKLKLGVSDRLRDSLHGLAGYVKFVQSAMFTAAKDLKSTGLSHDPSLWMTFLLLVHRFEHYRYTAPSNLNPATHTTLFTSLQDEGLSMPYLIDFVTLPGIRAAVSTIESTFEAVSRHLMLYMERSPNPRPKRA
jgi:hypothetical protein